MFESRTSLCRGSYLLGDSIVLASPDDSRSPDTGVCPVCGKTLSLGYALLVPAHQKPAPKARAA